MSQAELPSANGGLGAMGGTGGGVSGEEKVPQKSYKRKYRKLRHKFKEVMRRSDELFKQEQLAKQTIRRLQEENTRVLDFLVDLNECSHIPKERRHNIGSPSCATPPHFLSPEVYAARYGKYPEPEENGDVEQMDLDAVEAEVEVVVEAEVEVEETSREVVEEPQGVIDNESSDDDDDDDDEKTPVTGRGSKYNSDDDDGDTSEAYREEIREWNYRRGIAGTPPRSVREKMKADAENVRKEAEQHAKQAAEAAAAAEAEQHAKQAAEAVAAAKAEQEEKKKKGNGINNSSTVQIKKENGDEYDEPAELNGGSDGGAHQPPSIVEDYRRGQTPEYLRSGSPFLMTLKEEEEWYAEIEEKYEGGIPPLERPDSPSAIKAEGDPRNPMSVYCWLRKNQPQVFLQNEEVEGKKPRGRGRRKAVEAESGDEGMNVVSGKGVKPGESSKTGTSKRRKTNGNDATGGQAASGSTGSKGRGGPRGGRKADPPLKRQRSFLE